MNLRLEQLKELLIAAIDTVADERLIEGLLAETLGISREKTSTLVDTIQSLNLDAEAGLEIARLVQLRDGTSGGGRARPPLRRRSLERPEPFSTPWEDDDALLTRAGIVRERVAGVQEQLRQASNQLHQQLEKAADAGGEEARLSVLLAPSLPPDLAVAWLAVSLECAWPGREAGIWMPSSALRDRTRKQLKEAGHKGSGQAEAVHLETFRKRRGSRRDLTDCFVITHPPAKTDEGAHGAPALAIGIDVGLWGEEPRSGSKSGLPVRYHQPFIDAVLSGWCAGFSYTGIPDPFPCSVNAQGFPGNTPKPKTEPRWDSTTWEKDTGKRLKVLLEARDKAPERGGGAVLVFCNNQAQVAQAALKAREFWPGKMLTAGTLRKAAWKPSESPLVIVGRDVYLDARQNPVGDVLLLSPSSSSKMLEQLGSAIRLVPPGRSLRVWDLLSEDRACPEPRRILGGRTRVAALIEVAEGKRPEVGALELAGHKAIDVAPDDSSRIEIHWSC
jgi:hypothetical protein